MSFDIGINFRATSGYVTDGTNETYCLADSYPTTRGGATFGWTTSPNDMTRDRDSGIDRRLAGVNQTLNNGTPENFQLDLPRPGVYRVYCALGDAVFGQSWQYLQIKDGSAPRYTLDPGGTAPDEWWDMGGTKRGPASDWVTNGSTVYKDLKFASTTMNVVLGTPDSRTGGGGTNSTIAHLRVVFIKGVGIYKPSPELITNGDFSSTAGWNGNEAGGWSIGSGVLTGTNATGDIYRTDISPPFKQGDKLRISCVISDYTSGDIFMEIGDAVGDTGTPQTPFFGSAGPHSYDITYDGIFPAKNTYGGIDGRGATPFNGDIDSFSLKKIKAEIK